MKASCFVLVCFFLMAENFVNAINYEKCGSGKGIVTIRKFSFKPDPISLSGKTVTASMSVEVHDDIRSDMIVHTKIWKVSYIFGIKIYIGAPCVLGEGKCYMEYCELLNSFNADCVRAKGIYSAEGVTLNLPELGGVARWFASGPFHIEVRMYEKSSSREIGCYIITGETRS